MLSGSSGDLVRMNCGHVVDDDLHCHGRFSAPLGLEVTLGEIAGESHVVNKMDK